MKNIALTLATIVLLAACSSGSTVAPLPATVNSQFSGTFVNLRNTQSGTIRFDIQETEAGAVTGNMIVQSNGVRCIANGTVSGNNTGFNLALTSDQTRDRFSVTTTTRRVTGTDENGMDIISESVSVDFRDTGTPGTVTRDDGRGNTTTIVTSAEPVSGTINIQLAVTNNGNTLSGTYTTSDDLCSNNTGTGEMTLNRI